MGCFCCKESVPILDYNTDEEEGDKSPLYPRVEEEEELKRLRLYYEDLLNNSYSNLTKKNNLYYYIIK